MTTEDFIIDVLRSVSVLLCERLGIEEPDEAEFIRFMKEGSATATLPEEVAE